MKRLAQRRWFRGLTRQRPACPAGRPAAFTVNNGSTLQIGANGTTNGHAFFVTAGSIDFTGTFAYTAKGLTLGGGAALTTASVNTDNGTVTLSDGLVYNGASTTTTARISAAICPWLGVSKLLH